MQKAIPYIVIAALIAVILLMRTCERPPVVERTVDTVRIEVPVRVEIPGKPVPGPVKYDTIWKYRPGHAPSKDCDTLKKQYLDLGDKHFATHFYSTPFSLDTLGSITIEDSVRENTLVSSIMKTNLKIPVTTITIKEELKKWEFYAGGQLALSKDPIIPGIYGTLMFKDKKDRVFLVSPGYRGEFEVLAGTVWKIGKRKK